MVTFTVTSVLVAALMGPSWSALCGRMYSYGTWGMSEACELGDKE